MMSIVYIFWMYVILFAIIGAMRGWAKELLVSFSVVTALAVTYCWRNTFPSFVTWIKAAVSLFWVRTLILISLVYFGYQTVPSRVLHPKPRVNVCRILLFGAVLGGINGYLVAGTLLFYYYVANYPYPQVISAPTDPAIMHSQLIR